MPQITVTLTDEMYWEVRQLAKGRVSAFANEAVHDAVRACSYEPTAYVKYARDGIVAARTELERLDAARAAGQTALTNEEWMKKQKEENE